jgi:hypothetical protein
LLVTTKPNESGVLPAAAAAVRQAASIVIRAEPAGHALLPASPDTYAPAHDSTARTALGHAAAAAHSSDPSGCRGSTLPSTPLRRGVPL